MLIAFPRSQEKTIEQQLSRAIDNDNLHLEFQPIYSAENHAIVAIESLARWNDNLLGIISPTAFIRVAEQSNLICEVDLSVLEKTCQAISRWRAQITSVPVAANLSLKTLSDPHTIRRITSLIQRYQIDPGELSFEITENLTYTDWQQTRSQIRRLQSEGFYVALDDFGTGSASLQSILTLNFNAIKIDEIFSRNIVSDRRSRLLLGSIIKLINSVGAFSVVEGIDDQAKWDTVVTLGADRVQGFHFSEPLNEKELIALLID